MNSIFFEGMYGLGDNIYQRPFLRFFPGAYVRTPWPELYSDINVRCVRSDTVLRTQHKNELRTNYPFFTPPEHSSRRRISYGATVQINGGIIDSFRKQFGVSGPLVFDLPRFNDLHPEIPVDRRLAVIRPATVRTEWASSSRNPDPHYLNIAACMLQERGFFVISVADTEPGTEWIIGAAPVADLTLHHGELSLLQLCTLYERAACVVSPVGFSLPMAIAYSTPLFVVAGGRGGHNAPEVVTDPAMPLEKTRWAVPVNYCRCTSANHNCDKKIVGFEEKITRWLNEIVH
ncbi:hypothetical protein [Serratia proteamaculans]